MQHPASFPPTRARWGLRLAGDAEAARVERRWQPVVLLVLVGTIPAFYAELLEEVPPLSAALAYLLAAIVVAAALLLTARRCTHPWRHLGDNSIDGLLAFGLLTSAAMPPSQASAAALALRLAVSGLVLLRIVWSLRRFITRGGLAYLLLLALATLGLCGAGFWYLEPTVNSFGDGLWLAFTTAATVGYGDVVPTTPAAKIFAVFVVLLGFGVLSTVTAAIATTWVETEERRIEREILRDLRHQIDSLRAEIVALRDVKAPSGATGSRAGRRRSANRRSRSAGR
jgi:voltage-gated potassium channel